MNSAGPKIITLDYSPRWLFMPPIVAVFTIIATGFFSSSPIVPVDPAVWGLVGLMFVLLTFLYGIFIKQDFSIGLLPVQLIAQGILLCPLSLRMGAPAFSWVGVLLAICGAVILVALYYHSRVSQAAPRAAPAEELDILPLPFAITEADGRVISVSDLLLRLLKKNRAAVNGEFIGSILPLDDETASIGGKEWRILRTPMGDGTQYYQLEEARDASVTLPVNTGDEGGFVDPVSSLYNQAYAIKRVEEELYRIYRYKRWMSAAFLRVEFRESDNSTGFNAKKEDEIFNAYCRFLRSSTRETDISCLVGPRDILVVLPETQLDGAQDVVSKLMDFAPHLQEEIQGFGGGIDILERTLFFNASSGVMDFDRLMEKLDEAVKS